MERMVHFDVFADNPERMAGFYAQAFGLDFVRDPRGGDFWLRDGLDDGQSLIFGRVGKRPAHRVTGTPTIHTSSADEALARAVAAGGRVIVPRRAIPGIGHMAYCEDPEGNAFSIFQPDPTAQ